MLEMRANGVGVHPIAKETASANASAHESPSTTSRMEPPVVPVPHCPSCGGGGKRHLPLPTQFFGPAIFEPIRDRLGLVACTSCDFVYTDPRPSKALLDRFYGGLNQPKRGPIPEHPVLGTSAKAGGFLDYIAAHAPSPRGQRLRFFDYGAAEGIVLAGARDRGWDVLGYDVSDAYAWCKALGLPMVARIEDAPKGSFDVVFMNQVFEHLEDRDGVLQRCRALLAPGGKLFVQVPNAGSLRARLALPELSRRYPVSDRFTAFPVHLSYFTPATLPRFIERNGFRVDEVRTFGLGIDQLRREEGDSEEHVSAPASTAASARPRAAPASSSPSIAGQVKGALKDLFFRRARLGEQLMVVATREEGQV